MGKSELYFRLLVPVTAWQDSGYIFTRENGSPIHPQTLSDVFDARVRACKLKKLPFHSLRHTHATLWLKAGQSIKVLSERLGHSDIRITLGTYGHVLPGMQKEGAEAFGELMAGGN